MVRSLPRPSWERAVLLIAGFAVMVLPRPALPFMFPGRILQHQSITRPCEMVGRVFVRRRNFVSQAIKTGEWVLVKASGATAQVLSVNKGWLRVKEEGSDRIQSLRPTALHQLTQDAASVVDPNEDEQESYGKKSGPRSQDDNTPVLSQTAGGPLVVDAGISHPMHEETRDWLVFSDLHCSIQTLPVCLEVWIGCTTRHEPGARASSSSVTSSTSAAPSGSIFSTKSWPSLGRGRSLWY